MRLDEPLLEKGESITLLTCITTDSEWWKGRWITNREYDETLSNTAPDGVQVSDMRITGVARIFNGGGGGGSSEVREGWLYVLA